MTILCCIDREGGLAVVDTGNRVSAYADPQSEQAMQGRVWQSSVALEMLAVARQTEEGHDPALYVKNAQRIEDGKVYRTTCSVIEPIARIEPDTHSRDGRPRSVSEEMLAEARAELDVSSPGKSVTLDIDHENDREHW